MNAGMVLSMGAFFTLMAIGLAARLPHAMSSGLVAHGVDPSAAHAASQASPVGLLFAAFLGDNPVRQLVPHPGAHAQTATIYGHHFFPTLISEPFRHGLLIAFTASIIMLLLAAGASLMRGERFVHEDAHQSVAESTAREGDALAVPAVLGEDVAYDDALSGRNAGQRTA
jgi:hypothetical protein